jgi:DNA-binding GntR family transcriptional regulator
LRHRILTGALPGGTHLVQSRLASDLGVSTTPIREALRDLAAEGLIRLNPYRGAVVTPLSLADYREIYEIRQVMEPIVLRLAVPNLETADFRQLTRLCDSMDTERDPGRWELLNIAFHRVFMNKSGWPRLGAFLASLYQAASPYVVLALRFTPTLRQAANDEHRRIAHTARSGDIEQAVALCIEHMKGSQRAIEQRFPDPGQGSMEGLVRAVLKSADSLRLSPDLLK